jgi:hypothetical protein
VLSFRFLYREKFVLFTVFLYIARILLLANLAEELLEVVVKGSAYCLLANL